MPKNGFAVDRYRLALVFESSLVLLSELLLSDG